MSTHTDLLKSIAKTIVNYREGEITSPTSTHVDTWVKQFDKGAQTPLLSELDHVLKRTYISRSDCRKFLSSLIQKKDFASDDPCKFWKTVGFLNIQGAGNSQREMLAIFDDILQEQCKLKISHCGDKPAAFLYFKSALFTGYHVVSDLKKWIQTDAPEKANVRVVVMALHCGGEFNAMKGIEKAAASAGKQIEVTWWRCLTIENRKAFANTTEFVWPTSLRNA